MIKIYPRCIVKVAEECVGKAMSNETEVVVEDTLMTGKAFASLTFATLTSVRSTCMAASSVAPAVMSSAHMTTTYVAATITLGHGGDSGSHQHYCHSGYRYYQLDAFHS
jgi:hypothetical protein